MSGNNHFLTDEMLIDVQRRWIWLDRPTPRQRSEAEPAAMCWEEVGLFVGVGRVQARNICNQALAKCRVWLDTHGYAREDLP